MKWLYDMIDRGESVREEAEWKNENDTIKYWTGNDIGDEGARMISEGLKCNSTLTTLDLGGDNNLKKWSDCMIW